MKNGSAWIILIIVIVAVGAITFKTYSKDRLIFDDVDGDGNTIEVIENNNSDIINETVEVSNNSEENKPVENVATENKPVENEVVIEDKPINNKQISEWEFKNKTLTISSNNVMKNYNLVLPLKSFYQIYLYTYI